MVGLGDPGGLFQPRSFCDYCVVFKVNAHSVNIQ